MDVRVGPWRKWKWSHSVVSDSLLPHGQKPTRLLCPWDFPGKNTGVGCHFLLQGIFPTQVSCIAGRCFNLWATREAHQGSPSGKPIKKPMKKAEHQRIDAFELWCWIRRLRIPYTARRSNQSVLKEISPEYSLEGFMLKLNLQYFGTWFQELTHWKIPWCWERLKAGGEGDDRGWDGWIGSPTRWTWVWTCSGSWWWTGRPGMVQSCGKKESDTTEWLNWTEQKIHDTNLKLQYFGHMMQRADSLE